MSLVIQPIRIQKKIRKNTRGLRIIIRHTINLQTKRTTQFRRGTRHLSVVKICLICSKHTLATMIATVGLQWRILIESFLSIMNSVTSLTYSMRTERNPSQSFFQCSPAVLSRCFQEEVYELWLVGLWRQGKVPNCGNNSWTSQRIVYPQIEWNNWQ